VKPVRLSKHASGYTTSLGFTSADCPPTHRVRVGRDTPCAPPVYCRGERRAADCPPYHRSRQGGHSVRTARVFAGEWPAEDCRPAFGRLESRLNPRTGMSTPRSAGFQPAGSGDFPVPVSDSVNPQPARFVLNWTRAMMTANCTKIGGRCFALDRP